jgi:hypothetical protein
MYEFIAVIKKDHKSKPRQRNPIMDKSKKYQRAAKIVAAVHLFFTLFALLGGFLVIFAPHRDLGGLCFPGRKDLPADAVGKKIAQKGRR